MGEKMMKKILLWTVICFGIVGCGMNCSGEPPKRAYNHQGGGYGMRYHYSIYIPSALSGHSPSVKCTKYEYAKIDIYTDDLGTITGDKVIWNNLYGEVAFQDYGEDPKNITLHFSNEAVTISGWSSANNGVYKIETTPPESWGVPIH